MTYSLSTRPPDTLSGWVSCQPVASSICEHLNLPRGLLKKPVLIPTLYRLAKQVRAKTERSALLRAESNAPRNFAKSNTVCYKQLTVVHEIGSLRKLQNRGRLEGSVG